MPKQLNVDLTFRANTDQAKRQIADLQKSLQAVGTSSKGIDIGVNAEEIKKASAAAAELQRHLTAATDVNTGKLNLSTFSASLKASGKSLQQYKAELEAIGPQGQKAFDNLSRSIANAEAPIKRTNKLLAEMGTVLKNTIRWQISSTMIHGFMGAVQQAYGYVQDLNESLTNIRIVTGQSTEQMAAFADRANKAAQALSTTTTAYTDAALIFYQQGLSDKEVEERTNATIKMAQVTGDSAQEVSSYMTAIWNNFDDGSESLEHYADVITALGAATASSSAEISEGLEKFASIADTVGLSYEYATTALATVVAQTRQSADVVGTAFKTMFARIQDLELGKTLEDGTNLGQYSKALAKVGVDIMDTNGQLRAMDDILDDIGQRWSELGEAERVALAQNVAGQRQYAQFMAIFENWGTFQENLKVANTSDGTLQEQADIYAESWEAAEKRVKAAMEDIYDDILDDKFFIQLTNGFAEVLKSVKGLMEGMGGLKGMIPIFAGFITQKLAKEAPMALNKIKENLMIISGRAGEVANKTQQENLNTIQTEQRTFNNVYGISDQSAARQGELQGLEALAKARMVVNKNAHLYSEQERADAEAQIEKINEITQSLKEEGQEYDRLKQKRDQHLDLIQDKVINKDPSNYQQYMINEKAAKNAALVSTVERDFMRKADSIYQGYSTDVEEYNRRIQELIKSYDTLGNQNHKVAEYLKNLQTQFDLAEGDVKEFNQQISSGTTPGIQALKNLENALGQIKNYSDLPDEEIAKLRKELLDSATAAINFNNNLQQSEQVLPQLGAKITTTSELITSFSGTLMTASGLLTSITYGFKTLGDENTSLSEKIGAAVGIITSAIMTFNTLSALAQKVQHTEFAQRILNTGAIIQQGTVTHALNIEKQAEITETEASSLALTNDTKARMLNLIAILAQSKALHFLKSEQGQNLLAAEASGAVEKGTVATKIADSVATDKLTLSTGLLNGMLKSTLGTMALMSVALVAVGATLAATYGAIKLVIDAYNADAIAAEKAKKNAQELAEAYQNASQSYEELKNTISDYQSARDGLKELTKGTQEFRDALKEANDYASQLIETAHLTSDQYSWEDGVLTINEDVLEQAQQSYLQQMNALQAASISARTQALNASNLATNTNLARQTSLDNNINLSNLNYTSPYTALTGLQMQIGRAIAPEITESYLNLNGEIAGFFNNLLGNQEAAERNRGMGTDFVYGKTQRELEQLAEAYQEQGRIALLNSDLFNSATEEMQNSIEEYCESMAEATEATRLHNQEIAHSILSTEDYTDEIINFAAEGYDEAYQDIYDEVIRNSHNFEQGDTEDAEGAAEFFARYAEAAGLAPGIQLEGVVGDDDHRQYTYYDESGELVTRNEEYIASVIAASESIGSLSESAEQASQFLNGLSNQDNTDFYNSLFGNVQNGKVQYEEFLGQYITSNATSLSGEEILQNLGLTDEELISAYDIAGIKVKTIDPIINQIEEAYGNVQSNFAQYLTEQSDEISKYYHNNSNVQGLYFSDAQNVLDIYQEAINNNAGDLFTSITDNMSSDTLRQFGDTLSEIDWESITPRQFIQDLKDSGFEIEGYEEVLVRFCDSMRTVTADTLAATAEFYNGLQKIADGLSDQSDEISAEDFASLPEDMRQFFALTIDGTYKLLKSARDFQEYVEQSRIAEAIDNRNALYSQYQELGKTMSDEDFKKRGGGAQEAYDQYLAADMAIALHYDDLSELQQAYAEGTVETVEAFNTAAYQIDQAQDTAMLDQEAWQNYSDYIREAGSALEGFNDEMDDFEADIVAKSIMKMNQGVETLSSNFDEWRDVLENSTEASAEYADALIGTRKAIAMLLDISEDYVSSDFVTEHLDLIAQAAEGDAEAIDQLRVELSQNVSSMLASAVSSTEYDAQKIEGWLNDLTAQALAFDDLEVGASLYLNGKDGFVEALNEMIAATGMTVDQVNALCDSMGFEANFASESQEIKTQIPVYRIHHEVQDEGGKPLGEGQPVPHNWSEITWTEQLPDEEASTYAPAFAMTTDGTAPKINSVTKKPSGSANNLSSSNRGGGKPSGGGGSPKSGSKKDKKDPTGEIERYHVINNQIEDNEKALDQLSKAKDRAYGKARLNAMDAEIAKQRESVELAERKLQEVEKYLELDAGAIAAFGAEFDTNGTIVNYDQLMQEQIDKYNAAVEAYNNGPMDENAEALFQQAEDDYNAFLEALKQYEETQDLWYEQAQAVADAKAQVLQLELEKTAYKVEIGIEWEEDDINRLDFLLKRIEDDAFKAAEAIGLLGEKTVDAMDKFNIYKQGFADVLSNLGVTNPDDIINRAMQGEDLYGMLNGIVDPAQMAQAVEQMNDYITQMMSSLEQAQEAVDAAFEKVRDLFNENIKQMDTYIEKIEFCQKITKSYMNIIDIVGKKSLGITNEMLRTFNDQSVTQAVANETAAKARMDSIEAQLNESRERLAQATTEKEKEYWEKLIAEQEQELITATENFHQAWEDALQANLEAYENNLELMIEDFSDAVGDLNAMRSEWDLQKSLTDMWEPEFERWHQLSTLISDINKSVEGNENLKYKNELLDLEKEIEGLQEEEAKLSEYDLNYLRLRYEAKLAEIALEEAQNAKSQVRMSRDSEGNYSYVYTADEEAVNNAADDYRNKIYEMEKANEEYIDTLQQQLMDMHDQMLEDIKEAGEIYGYGTEAYFDAVNRIEETYYAKSEFIQQQMQNVFDNNQRLRDEDIVDYVQYTGDIAAANVDLQLDFGDTFMGIQTGSDDLNTYFSETWLPSLRETFDNVIAKTQEYNERNEEIMNAAGTSMSEFGDLARSEIESVTDATSDLAKQTEEYGDSAADAFAEAAQAWQNGPAQLLESIQAQMDAVANLAQQYINLKSQLDAAAESARALAAAMNQPVRSYTPSSIPSPGGSGQGPGGGGSSSTSPSPDTPQDLSGAYRAQQALVAELVKELKKPMTSEVQARREELRRQLHELEARYGLTPSGYETGGYTGEWGDDGRLAILHQKELVLNAKDTSNILSAVDVVRQLASSIDLNTMAANLAGTSISLASGNAGTIEQKVEISASFPNVTDRNEIEQAFNNLVNNASQYANRKD